MSFISILLSLILAIVISLLFFYVIKIKGPWNNYWLFAIVLFLSILGTTVWINPTQPTITEIHWMPSMITGFIIAFILAAATPTSKARRQMEKDYEQQSYDSRVVTVSLFFWILLFMLFALVIAGMFYQPLS